MATGGAAWGEAFLPWLTSGSGGVDVSPSPHSAEVLVVGTEDQEAGLAYHMRNLHRGYQIALLKLAD